ncbi:hypothetical protein [Bifidobacterium gallicum]|uniref:Uncharacterized protein n=1 Tax=Bifidobacterium gallicum DSM 20093 = LMG 11596 TaxID=561180 RepID=D1NV83_9BIFI|nr:hypothetical protein [Bifidobacterium gallicum]EFA22734.1 hypothetical protein BIFGAL_03767 [Bifidobacterium gallicum DSM 20093 = LMG 11596]KFI59680.1 hypothetical protein BGLCM_0349 [Bifidobacterium gallicum DSM 20093 = LMG 11596]
MKQHPNMLILFYEYFDSPEKVESSPQTADEGRPYMASRAHPGNGRQLMGAVVTLNGTRQALQPESINS